MGNTTSSPNGLAGKKIILKKHILKNDAITIDIPLDKLKSLETPSCSFQLIDTQLCSDSFIRNAIPVRVYVTHRVINEDKNTYKLYLKTRNSVECYTHKQLIKDIKKNIQMYAQSLSTTHTEWSSNTKVTYERADAK
jgi:hypothetical protein